MTEPFIPADLEYSEDDTASHAVLLRCLAKQLGVGNDFYFPLLGVARHLEIANDD